MKSKRILLVVLFSVSVFASQNIYAQDVSLNLTGLQPSILNFTIGEVEVMMCNEDPGALVSPPNKLRPLISLTENLTILDAVNPDGTPISNFTVQSLVNDDDNHSIRLLYNGTLAPGECVSFHVRFRGNAVGPGDMNGTLGFAQPGGQTIGNNVNNDNSNAGITVDINLPVTLKEFNVGKAESTAILDWSTTEETNSDYFEIQRSIDGKDWVKLQRISAQGESRAIHNYNAVDESPMAGENFYRLHMVDKDGSSAYSRIRNVSFEGTGALLFPNPVSSVLNIEVADWNDIAGISIQNLIGKEVYFSGDKISKQINVDSLAPGIYFVQFTKKTGRTVTHKIVVAK